MDLDAIPIPPEQTSDSQLDENSEAAQRLHKSIARIADVGIEEQELRRLIQETKNFLQGKPRHLVSNPSGTILHRSLFEPTSTMIFESHTEWLLTCVG